MTNKREQALFFSQPKRGIHILVHDDVREFGLCLLYLGYNNDIKNSESTRRSRMHSLTQSLVNFRPVRVKGGRSRCVVRPVYAYSKQKSLTHKERFSKERFANCMHDPIVFACANMVREMAQTQKLDFELLLYVADVIIWTAIWFYYSRIK